MSNIIAVNSFRRGAGCSNIVANLAVLLAAAGKRVGIVDTNIQSPSLHLLFGLEENEITATLYDYLWNRCSLEEIVHPVSLPLGQDALGQLFLIPISAKSENFTDALRKGYDVKQLNASLEQLAESFNLDALLIDTQPGLNEETMLSIAIADILVILLRPDKLDYQGTSLTVQVARELKVPRLMLIVNEVPAVYDVASVRAEVVQSYECEVGAVLPHSNRLMALAGTGIFVLHYPSDPFTLELKQAATHLMS